MLEIIGASHQNDDPGMNPVQFSILQPPEYVLNRVTAPPKIGGVPSEEILVPIRQQLVVLRVARAPPPSNRIPFKIDLNPAAPGFFQKLGVSFLGITIEAWLAWKGCRWR